MKAALVAIAVALVAGSADPIVVTRDSLNLPAGCSPREVAQTIVRFFDAYNRRDLAALDRMFAPPREEDSPYVYSDGFKRSPTFRWYTTAGTRVFDRERLLAHFASQQDELRLRGIDTARSWVLRSVGFSFRAMRDKRRVHGKGELHCPSKRIYVWSEAPTPDEWALTGPIVAESRTGRRPSAQEVSPDYRLATTTIELPGRCRPAPVGRRVLTMLRAFNLGDDAAFRRGLAAGASVVPSVSTASAYAAGKGWTAAALLPGRPAWRLRLADGRTVTIVVDCRSGLVRKWVGPAVRPPG